MSDPVKGTSLWRRTSAAVAVLFCAALALSGCGSIYDLPLPGGAKVGSHPMKVHIMFRDVLDLVPQSTVKIDDVTVGKVTAIKLKGYVADVTVELPRGTDLPANATAGIEQTSLLGEKFVSLSSPSNPSSTRLKSGDTIGLDSTGRDPQVEEVLGALALLLNGGGVGQLKTIASELNNAVGGREDEVRSIITQIHSFMGTLDQHRAEIVSAIDNVNRLAAALRKQDGTIKSTLDDLPAALKSINGQRADLVKVLKALDRLSSVGVKVIKASKESTIDSLQDLAPVLDQLAKAGKDLPDAFQVVLTYPFVDAAVGNSPTVARNLHMGDYVDLSIRLDLDLNEINLPSLPVPTVPLPSAVSSACTVVKAQVEKAVDAALKPLPLPAATKASLRKTLVTDLVEELDCKEIDANQLAKLVQTLLANLIQDLPASITKDLCANLASNPVCKLLTGSDGSPIPLPTIGLPSLPGLGGLLGRADPGSAYQEPQVTDPFGLAKYGVDPSLGTLLLQGVATSK